MKLCYCWPLRRHRGRPFVGAVKPVVELDPGFLEHLRLSPGVLIGPGARFIDFIFGGAPRRRHVMGGGMMEVLHPRCCGLDVHKDTVVACLRIVSDGKVATEVRTFQTTMADQFLHSALINGPRGVSARGGG
jgi:hypothetical protein